MCSVPKIELPTVDLEFSIDDCPCHAAPIEMVEIWRPGQKHQSTTRMPISQAKRDAGLWIAIRSRYENWRTEPAPLLIADQRLNVLVPQPAFD